jgi:glycine cleavage system H protein
VRENQQRKASQIPLEANWKEPMTYPASYRYTTQHEWIDVKDNVGTIGITDYAQHELGDVVFVELPKPGAKVEAGKSFGNVESVKAVSEIYAPVSGEVLEANADLEASPEKLNSDPHTAAWLIRVKLADPSQLSKLMDATAYEAFIAAKDKEASA